MHESAKGNSILLLGKTNGVSDSYTLHLKLVGKILNNKPIGPHFEWKQEASFITRYTKRIIQSQNICVPIGMVIICDIIYQGYNLGSISI